MRIKESSITRYGPLVDLGRKSFANFNLVFGENESGKTLLLDAFIKMLFQKKSEVNKFHGIERVDENPEGYLIIEKNGTEHKLPEHGDVNSLFNIPAVDFRNIFIVRNSDLIIPDEAQFYTNVTERLTGLHSNVINKVKKEIQEIGKLTKPSSEAQLADRKEWGKQKSQRDKTIYLLTKIEELEKCISEENLESIEKKLIAIESDLNKTEQQQMLLEEAKERGKYERSKQSLSSLVQNTKTLENLINFKEENLAIWRDNEKRIQDLNTEINNPKSTLQLKKLTYNAKVAGILLFGSFLLTIISIIGLIILKGMQTFLWIVGSALVLTLILAIIWLVLWQRQKDKENSISEETQTKKEAIIEGQNQISRLSKKFKVQTLEEFEQKYQNRKDIEESLTSRKGKLEGMFGLPDSEDSEAVEFWNKKVQELSKYSEKAIGIEFNQVEYDELIVSEKELEVELSDTKDQLEDLQETLQDIEREANLLLQTREIIPVDTIIDLRGIKNTLSKFAEDIEAEADLARETIRIFEEIEEQEAEKVAELFSSDGEGTKIFSKITNGVYQEVGFDHTENKLWVMNKAGEKLDANQLSGGTYNQLYLAIRLGLALKILQGQKGFLLLDDPFLMSDTTRLRKQLEVLLTLSQEGWQIFYFSAKDEIRNLLEKEIKKKNIMMHELSTIHSR